MQNYFDKISFPVFVRYHTCTLIAAVVMVLLCSADAHAAGILRIVVKDATGSNPTGHVYVEIVSPAGVTYARGLAPQARNYILQAGSTGKVRDDLNYEWDYYIKFDITNAEYNRIARRINFDQLTPPGYKLLDDRTDPNEMNCVGWAKRIMQAINPNTTIPTTVNNVGINDPVAFASSLAAIGAGGTYLTVRQNPAFPDNSAQTLPFTGTVFVNPNPNFNNAGPSSVCYSPGHLEVEALAHQDPTFLSSMTAIPVLEVLDPTPKPVNLAAGAQIIVSGVDPTRKVISMNWGDPSNPVYTSQSVSMQHVYAAPGTYFATLVLMDESYIRRYGYTFDVSERAVTETVFLPFSPDPLPPPVLNDCLAGPDFVLCQADANGDTVVNVLDLLIAINEWGPCSSTPACDADIDPEGGDGVVNANDLLFIINNWGPCPTAP